MEDLDSNTGEVKSLVASAVKDRVEDEKCVVTQYRTTTEQKDALVQHLSTCRKNSIPIEWVIDIADESNGWFYGTAYHYDDTTQMLHVMVPDKENPTFDGHVLLDHRTVHLIECVDGVTDALFNKINRDSVVKVKWDVEWFEESEDGRGESESWAADGTMGSWITSSARYYIRIANQLLVEDKDVGQDTRGFVIITADLNLKLLKCHKNKGIEDFQRLINEGVVQSSAEAAEVARAAMSPAGTPAGGGINSKAAPQSNLTARNLATNSEMGSPSHSVPLTPATKLADMSTGLRECVVDLLDDRDRMKAETNSLADMFNTFTLEGDLDAGMKLMSHFEAVRARAEKMREAQTQDSPVDMPQDDEDKIEAIADDAICLAQKLERNLAKIVRAGGEVSNSAQDEIENLRKALRKARSDLDAKQEEVDRLHRA